MKLGGPVSQCHHYSQLLIVTKIGLVGRTNWTIQYTVCSVLYAVTVSPDADTIAMVIGMTT